MTHRRIKAVWACSVMRVGPAGCAGTASHADTGSDQGTTGAACRWRTGATTRVAVGDVELALDDAVPLGDGALVALYLGGGSPLPFGAYLQHLDADGHPQGDPQPVSQAAPEPGGLLMALGFGHGGIFDTGSSDTCRFSPLDAAGSFVGTTTLFLTGQRCTSPVATPTGYSVLRYLSGSPGNPLLPAEIVALDADGSLRGRHTIDVPGTADVSVWRQRPLADGSSLVVTRDPQVGGERITAQRFDAAASPVGEPVAVDMPGPCDDSLDAIVVDDDLVVSGTFQDATGTPRTQLQLVTLSTGQLRPRITMPIRLRSGDTHVGAALGSLLVLERFEQPAGVFSFWATAIDRDGNPRGEPFVVVPDDHSEEQMFVPTRGGALWLYKRDSIDGSREDSVFATRLECAQ